MFKSACWTYEHEPTRRRCRSFLAKSNPRPLDMASHWFCWNVPILLKMWCPDSFMAYHIHVRYIYIYIIMYCNIPHPRHFWYAFHALFSLFTFHKSTSCQGTKTDFCIPLYTFVYQWPSNSNMSSKSKSPKKTLQTCWKPVTVQVVQRSSNLWMCRSTSLLPPKCSHLTCHETCHHALSAAQTPCGSQPPCQQTKKDTNLCSWSIMMKYYILA